MYHQTSLHCRSAILVLAAEGPGPWALKLLVVQNRDSVGLHTTALPQLCMQATVIAH